MKVLVITPEWPTPDKPNIVPFLVRQITYLRKHNIDIDIFHIKGNQSYYSYIDAFLKLRKIIKKGWPGKVEHVLERQTDLVLLSIYGFYDYCSGLTSKERQVMLNDLSNMLNLHLQDRLFF